jgi:nitroimidazol reductase NimA-like FMN-containing flavoprotein (pyridoxamine 5'-phosphate oxidase superfamily)
VTDAWLEELTFDEALRRLRTGSVGRVATVVDDFPVVLPVNYRVVETKGREGTRIWLAIRTRPGNVLDRATIPVAFEIDAIDPSHREGWSVLVRGTLAHVDPDSADFRGRFDPEPWMTADREAWLVIEPFAITGRQLHARSHEWPFVPDAYC